MNAGRSNLEAVLQKPSFECVDALEDSDVWALSHQDFLSLAASPDGTRCYQKMLELANTLSGRAVFLSSRIESVEEL